MSVLESKEVTDLKRKNNLLIKKIEKQENELLALNQNHREELQRLRNHGEVLASQIEEYR